MQFKAILCYYFQVVATAAAICPILGPVFPAPKELHLSASFQDKLRDLQRSLDNALTSGNTTHGSVNPNDTYSIQIFSTTSEELILDYHQSGSNLLGKPTVDGDSVYRIASTSKLITVYLLLLQAGEHIFSEKVTKYVPELAGAGQWDDISVGSLASYLGGITAELFDTTSLPGGDLYAAFPPGSIPSLAVNETAKCSYNSSECSRKDFTSDLRGRSPVYLPNTTPAYGNAAFGILGLVLETVANSTYEQALQRLLLEPLTLNGTSISEPQDLTNAIIPGDATTSGWNAKLSNTPGAAIGGLFSTPNDLSAIGRAILSSTLLPSSATRAWLKPKAFTSSLIGAVGYGWEIYRAVLDPSNNRVIDLYTKTGNLPGYESTLILIPDFDIGITVMMAGNRGKGAVTIAGIIIDVLLPALDETARQQADIAFSGTYTAKNGLNSTVKLTTTPGIPGLSIEEWISNSTDLRHSVFAAVEAFQMFPTNVARDKGSQVSWRSTYISIPDTGSPFDACPSWGVIDRPAYGIYSLDHFVFHVGEDGKAWGLEPKALKILLEKV